jgi:hypothetical protein
LLNDNDAIIKAYESLELPDENNKRNVSCIPEGTYQAIKHQSPKHGDSLWVQNVPNRSEILIHKGNYYTDILGCILIGDDLADINRDGIMDVTNSRNSVIELISLIDKDEIEIEIIS